MPVSAFLKIQTIKVKLQKTVGRNKKVIAEYIRNQLEEDYAADQMSIKEYNDPFTGDKNKRV